MCLPAFPYGGSLMKQHAGEAGSMSCPLPREILGFIDLKHYFCGWWLAGH